jgi:hypothetical protein
MIRKAKPRPETERSAVARGLRTQAKRLRYLAKDVGDKHTVRAMSRELEAQATALDGETDQQGAPPEPGCLCN